MCESEVKMDIIALTTCHNRCSSTLRSLRSLGAQRRQGVSLDVCVVDDGSTDGTGAALREEFPWIQVLAGSGKLFWAGGMRLGWQNYVALKSFTHLLVFNDDVLLYPSALETLLSVADKLEAQGSTAYAVCGAMLDPATGATSYSGVRRSSWWHPLRFEKVQPSGVSQPCDTLNMNLALISRAAIDEIGFLSSEFVHGKADYDFGLRLRKAGGEIVVAPGYLGECSDNPVRAAFEEPGLGFTERWKRLTNIKTQNPRERALYYRRHAGLLWPLYWALPYVRVSAQSAAAEFRERLRKSISGGH